MWCRALSVPIGIIILLTVGGGFALAEDAPIVEGEAGIGVSEAGDEGMLSAEIENTPTYEETYEENLTERYFRITRDFIKPQLLGLGRIGEVPRWPHGILKAGPFRFSPYLTTALGWQSNVFLDEENEKSSWFWEGRVGMTGDAGFLKDKLRIRASAEMDYRNYTRKGVDDSWEGVLGLSSRYTFPVGIWVEVGAVYSHLFDPIDEEDVPTRMERDQVDYSLDVGLDQAFKKIVGRRWKLQVGADFRTRNFHDRQFDLGDRTEWDVYVRLSYELREELDIFIQYLYGETLAQSNRLNDGTRNELTAGLDGSFPVTASGRLQGQVFFGYSVSAWDSAHAYKVGGGDFTTDNANDAGRLRVGAQLRYLMGTRTQLTGLYTRSTEFSLKGNYQYVDRVDLSANYIILDRLSGRAAGYWERDDPSTVNNVYRYGAGLGVRYAINDVMDVDLSWDGRWRNDTQARHPTFPTVIRGTDYVDHRVILALTFYLR